jgi:Arylsulfotransferase (ASST)
METSNDNEGGGSGVITRRSFLRAGGALTGVLATGGPALAALGRPPAAQAHDLASLAQAQQVLRFHSRPDLLPPPVWIKVARPKEARGHMFIGPRAGTVSQAGSLIVDNSGQPIFFQPVATMGDMTTNVGVQTYNKKPALVWWEGALVQPGYGQGTCLIHDHTYRELLRVSAARGRWMDLHEFQLTPEGTALFTLFPLLVDVDLSSVGGPKAGKLYSSGFQEVDLRTGRVLLEWNAIDHIAISESYFPMGEPWDYLHLNSIDVLPDGNLLVSGRHTFALYKLNRKTGKVMWRMGGKRSDFDMGTNTQFAWQHDARHLGASKITLFDDGSFASDKNAPQSSRGLMLDVDYKHKKVRFARQYLHPTPLIAIEAGNMQTLRDGHVVVGWGSAPLVSEFTADGRLLFDMQVPGICASYRGFRYPWYGAPSQPPAIAATTNSRTGETVLYASWNGATAVARWQVLGGSSANHLAAAATVARSRFETAINLGRASGYVAVAALDAKGRRLATSAATKL